MAQSLVSVNLLARTQREGQHRDDFIKRSLLLVRALSQFCSLENALAFQSHFSQTTGYVISQR